MVGIGVGIDYVLLIFNCFRLECGVGCEVCDVMLVVIDMFGCVVLFVGVVVVIVMFGMMLFGILFLYGLVIGVVLLVLFIMGVVLMLMLALLSKIGGCIKLVKIVGGGDGDLVDCEIGFVVCWSCFVVDWLLLVVVFVFVILIVFVILVIHMWLVTSDVSIYKKSDMMWIVYDLFKKGFGLGFNVLLLFVVELSCVGDQVLLK